MRTRLTELIVFTGLLAACSAAGVTEPGADVTIGVDGVTPDEEVVAPVPDTWTDPVEDVEPPPGDGAEGTCPEGGGCFGDPCEDPEDCWSGFCTNHLGDGTCTKTCETDCPDGWSCEQVLAGGGDPVYICVSNTASLCRPCIAASDCKVNGVEDACVRHGDAGNFCGAACTDDLPCPDGFTCALAETTAGGTSLQCIPTEGDCSCSQTAMTLGLSTSCSVTNEHGSCIGARACSPDGLSDCDALVPAVDGCDHIDNDCDGETDEACSYRVSGFVLGDGAGVGASEGATVSGALGAPRVIGSSSNALWTVRSGLVWSAGE
jgi:hypothetical protein